MCALAHRGCGAERISVRLTKTHELSITLLPTLFAAVLFGPLAAAVVGGASMLGDPELSLARRESSAPAEVGDLHEHTLHRRGSDWPGCAGHVSIRAVARSVA